MILVIEAITGEKPIVFTQHIKGKPTASVYFDVLADFAIEHSDKAILRVYVERKSDYDRLTAGVGAPRLM